MLLSENTIGAKSQAGLRTVFSQNKIGVKSLGGM